MLINLSLIVAFVCNENLPSCLVPQNKFSLLGIIKMPNWACLFHLASEIILSFLPHFPPLHVQTWTWSKSSLKSVKLFFSFSHEPFFLAVLQLWGSFSFHLNFLLFMSIVQAFHPAVFVSLCAWHYKHLQWAVLEFVSNSSVSPPRSSSQLVHPAPTNQREHQEAWAPACHAPTSSTPPSLAAPPSVTASASRAISQ